MQHNTIQKLESMLSSDRVKKARNDAQNIMFNIKLSKLRIMQGIKQEDIKQFSQSSLSKIENRKDIKLSTLREYLLSIGMDLEIRAKPRNSKSKKKEVILLK